MTLQEQIELSFGDGPEPPPLELTLAAGHRALRRRRIGAVVAAAAVLAVVGTGVTVAVAHQPTGPREPDVPAATAPLEGRVDAHPFSDGRLAAWTEDGTVQVREGARIVERVDDPVGLGPDGDSVALVLEREGERQWLLLTWDPDGTGAVRTTPERAGATFEVWLSDLVAEMQRQTARNERRQEEMAAAEHLVEFGEGEALVATTGDAVILDQQASPHIAHLGPPEDRSAVAMLNWDGEVWFVLARQYADGGPVVMRPTPARLAGGATTIAEYVDWANEGAQ